MMHVLEIHQMGALGMIGDSNFINTATPSYLAFMTGYRDAFRNFKHGALRGFMAGIFSALPIISINGRFERKS